MLENILIYLEEPQCNDWHVENKAEFENVGQWKRAWYYPINGESMHEAVQRESIAARESAGILDASTLGKIDIQGSDASEFLKQSLYKCLVKTWYR